MNNPLTQTELELILELLQDPDEGKLHEILDHDVRLARQIPGPMGGPSLKDIEKYLCARLENTISQMAQDEAFEE